jgi:hypothetical protein
MPGLFAASAFRAALGTGCSYSGAPSISATRRARSNCKVSLSTIKLEEGHRGVALLDDAQQRFNGVGRGRCGRHGHLLCRPSGVPAIGGEPEASSSISSGGEFGLMRSHRHALVDAFEQHRELHRRQRHAARCGPRPDAATALQPLGQQHEALPVEPEYLEDVAASAAEERRRGRRTGSRQARSAPARRDRRSPSSCRCGRPRSTPACSTADRSCEAAQRDQHGAQAGLVDITAKPHAGLADVDLDGAARGSHRR